jgi:hypothetical protein
LIDRQKNLRTPGTVGDNASDGDLSIHDSGEKGPVIITPSPPVIVYWLGSITRYCRELQTQNGRITMNRPHYICIHSSLYSNLAREITNTLPTLFDPFLPQADFTISTADCEDVACQRPADSPDCVWEMRIFGWCRWKKWGGCPC